MVVMTPEATPAQIEAVVERMEAEGLVSKADRVGRREILQGERAV